MHWLLLQIPSLLVGTLSFIAFSKVGQKARSGWVWALVAEAGFIAWGSWLAQWGFVLSCIPFVFLYVRNWSRWS